MLSTLKNNFVALFAHVCISAVLSFLYIYSHFDGFSKWNFLMCLIVASTVFGLLLYILIGYAKLQNQRTVVLDFLSVISAGIMGLITSALMLIELHRVSEMFPFANIQHILFVLDLNFSDVMGLVWQMEALIESTLKSQIILFIVASFTPSLLMWVGMLIKRNRLII